MIKANASVNLMDLTSVFESYEFAPVHAFKHIPLSRCWETMFQDDQCTVEIVHESTGEDRVWFAEVLSHKGISCIFACLIFFNVCSSKKRLFS